MRLPKKIELGCGNQKERGWYGVDQFDTPETDQVIDLDSESWDLPSGHFKYIRAIDVFEHLDNPINFVEEIFRIAVEGATVEIRGPHRSSQNWTDPTHKRLLGTSTFKYYFTDRGEYNFYSDARFITEDIFIEFWKEPYFPWNYIIERLINMSPDTQRAFELTAISRVFPAHNIRFIMSVEK